MWTELLVIFVLVLVNGLFAGAEIAILSVRKSRLGQLADQGVAAAESVLRLRSQPERFLATIQIGITLVSVTAAAFGGATLVTGLADLLAAMGIKPNIAQDIALAVIISSISFLSLVLGELVPKSLALRSGEYYALLAGRPLSTLAWLARPIIWVLTASSNLVLRFFRDETTFTETRFSREEIQQVMDEAATVGTIDIRAGDIASRALDLSQVPVGAVMIPRAEVVAVSRDADQQTIRDVLVKHGHTRLPVHDGNPDGICGYVTVRDLLPWLTEPKPQREFWDLVRPIESFLETAPVLDVLNHMQKQQSLIGLVVDEHGTIAGLVTLEDLVEELVGEIFEEHEKRVPRIQLVGPGQAEVQGSTPVHEVNRTLGVDLPVSPKWATVSGMVTTMVGEVPTVGHQMTLNHAQLEVLDATERRVVKVRLVWKTIQRSVLVNN